MAIAIREFLGYEGFQIEWDYKPDNKKVNLVESIHDKISSDSLMVEIEGIHVGPTRNYTWYTQEALESSISSWTKPYLRPLIMHHNEKDGKIIGRIRFVTYTEANTRSGTGALLFTTNVPDAEGKEQIEDGRLKTVSIGVIVHDCRCSICEHNIAEEGECEHERGLKYDGKKCYWIIYSMEAKELSYVIVPSDIYAHNVRVYKPTKADMNIAANYDSKGVLNMAEKKKTSKVIESAVVDEVDNTTVDNTKELEALKAERDELKVKNEDLEKEVSLLKDEKNEMVDNSKKIEDELESTKVLLSQAQKSVDEVKDTLSTKENELGTEKTLRETLENQIIEITSETKKNLIENVLLLRQTLGKPIGIKEDLDNRTEQSLRDAIVDLKEELTNPVDVNKITLASNPAIVEEQDNKPNVDKEKKAGNIDLAEGLENVFSAIIGSKGKQY